MPGSRTGAIHVGLRASAAFGAARQRTGHIRVGLLVAATSPSWAGRARGARAKVDWIPPQHVPITQKDGLMNPVWYRFFREIAETRLGGVNGSSVAEVATTVTSTQAEVAAAVTYTQGVAVYAQGVAATASATAQVTQTAGLSGSASIPDPPEPPERFPGA